MLALAGAATMVVVSATPAGAHVTPDKSEVPAGGFTAIALTVPHGCDGSPTNRLDIEVPESILNVTPEMVPGWNVDVATEPLAEPVEGGHGEEITERESVVTYTAQPGQELPDGLRLSFTLGFRAPDTPGEHLFFKTVQGCIEGETAWVEEYTGEGEEPEHPSPVVLVTESEGDAEEPEESADEELAATPTASTGDDDDATGIAVTGLVVGALGLLTGGAALLRSRRA